MESLFSLFADLLMERGAGTSVYSDAAVSPGLDIARPWLATRESVREQADGEPLG